ncbi:MAG: glycine--tRNA ligase subunit beta [Magnetococcales bacterium]|nr:glycine--tRNA ligase subunit beta [Magnetococcales bacterium]MBF0157397.1 glycine--tRNA ligase subunit beta [Magnetococcales bacterium]
MSELLWEIGTEEIPARMLPQALVDLRERLSGALTAAGLAFGEVVCHGTPRRLVAIVSGLAGRQAELREERRGPAVKAAFAEDGTPTRAAMGFAKGLGVEVEALTRVSTPKGDYLGYTLVREGKAAVAVLPGLLRETLEGFPWPKSMRWGEGKMRFVRPVHWLLALLDGEPLRVETEDGLVSGRQTRGHRFFGMGPHAVRDVAHYRELLAANRVMLEIAEREAAIRAGVMRLAGEVGGVVADDPGLVSENACLTEWPVPLLGRFSEGYLAVPGEVLVTAMRHHQKYFAVRDAAGHLLPCFILVANREGGAEAEVLIRGNERVLRARLEDAAFFWHEDRKHRLRERLPALDAVVFQARLGSLGAKAVRLSRLAAEVAASLLPDQVELAREAGLLAKCDLVSGMVGQFPELQGVMGGHYARHDGLAEGLAVALGEQYQPQGAGDRLPASPLGRVLSLADKLDTLAGCFGIGLVPTGAKDPFALRRAALGIIRMVTTGEGVALPLRRFLGLAHDHYAPGVLDRSREESVAALLEFFYGRLKAHLKADGFDYDLIDAAQALGLDDMADVVARVVALGDFKRSEAYVALVRANKRIANILGQAGMSGVEGDAEVDSRWLREEEERELHAGVRTVAVRVEGWVRSRRYGEALAELAGLRERIDRFFDRILVMAEDAELRRNRLALLAFIRRTFNQVADISRLVLPED